MRDVKINATKIGSSVVSEKSTIEGISSTVSDREYGNDIDELAKIIFEQSKKVHVDCNRIHRNDIEAIVKEINRTMNKIATLSDHKQKKLQVEETLNKIKRLLGNTTDIFKNIFVLAKMMGIG